MFGRVYEFVLKEQEQRRDVRYPLNFFQEEHKQQVQRMREQRWHQRTDKQQTIEDMDEEEELMEMVPQNVEQICRAALPDILARELELFMALTFMDGPGVEQQEFLKGLRYGCLLTDCHTKPKQTSLWIWRPSFRS